MPPSYWAEALSTATLLLNILPTKTLQFSTPHLACTTRRRRMLTYKSLATSVIQTYPPPLLINSLLGLPCASS